MEEVDKGCSMIRMGVSGWVFLLVPAYLSSPGPKAVKRLYVTMRRNGRLLSPVALVCGVQHYTDTQHQIMLYLWRATVAQFSNLLLQFLKQRNGKWQLQYKAIREKNMDFSQNTLHQKNTVKCLKKANNDVYYMIHQQQNSNNILAHIIMVQCI